jgi:Ala-tRNA(Pro) deacylase
MDALAPQRFSGRVWRVGCKVPIMTILQRCQRSLKQHGIRYAHSIHAPACTAREVASAERMPVHAMAKTVVYRGDIGFGMLVLPADCAADLREVQRLLGLREIRLATEAELAQLFPQCDLGAMPPLANLFDLPLLMDERIATADFMAFNAGTYRDVIHMSVADFHKLVNPLVAGFAVAEPVPIS